MTNTSSWSWRNLLSSNSSDSPAGPGKAGGLNGRSDEVSWAQSSDHPLDLPNVLGMENFGNTCYVNSVLQALWFCDPFRESILAYLALRADAAAVDENGASSSKKPMSDPKQVQQQEVVTLFAALQTLFQRMATAKDIKAVAAAGKSPESAASSSPQAPSSFGSSLSRKVSSRPTTTGRGGAGNIVSSPSAATANASANSNSTLQIGANGNSASSCSNVLVPNSDIKAFLLALKKSNILFDSTAHQDAHELLNHVLNAIGDDLVAESRKRNKDTSATMSSLFDVSADNKTFVHRIFEGVLTNETRCMTCESVTSRDECFLDLSLDIERNMSVSGCLQQFSASEMLCSRNKFFCDTCSALQEAEKRMKIKKQPVVLALHLKRFKYEESMGRFVKLAYRVVFPMELRLTNISDDADEPDKLYKLYGIIVHIGQGPHHGHYIAILRISTRWFLFDDETIRIIDEEDIQRYYGEAGGPGSAYVLFYQAADMDFEAMGIPNLPQIRAEKAKRRRQEAAMAAKLEERIAFKRAASRDASSDFATDSAIPSRTSTPAEGKSSLFGRRGFNMSSSSSGNMLNSSSETSTPQNESAKSSSWLSNFKPRKASISIVQPSTKFSQSGGNALDADAPATSPIKQTMDHLLTKDALANPNNTTANPASHLARQRSPARSQHSEQSQARSISPHAAHDASLGASEVSSSVQQTYDAAPALATPVKPSAGQRVLSGLGIGSPPRRTSTLPLTPEGGPSLTAASNHVVAEPSDSATQERHRSNSVMSTAFGRGRSATSQRPATADALGGEAGASNGRSRLRSPSGSGDAALNNAGGVSPNPSNATGSLSRRRTTLSRAFGGLMRGNKDKDKN